MPAPSLASLLIQETKTAIYDAALVFATTIGLNTSSWQPGDPTRSLFFLEAEFLERLEAVVVGYVGSGFLDYASGEWLKILAQQVFNVDVPDAIYAETDVVLTNAGGGVYDIDPGDLTFKSSTSDKTYHNTTGGHLNGLGALTVSVIADEAGSSSSAGAGEIDALVTGLLGVTCTNPVAAVGVDEQSEDTTRQQCRDKLGSLSPNGPKDAYSYVARNAALTGIKTVTRVRVYSDSDTGDVIVYLAGPSGAISSPDVAAVEAAIALRSTPLCITPTVLSANGVGVPVTYELWVYKSCNKTSAEIAADIQTALEDMFASRPIGGDIIPPATTGALYVSMIEATIKSVFPQAFRCAISAPSVDVALGNGDVPELGSVTFTIHLVVDP